LISFVSMLEAFLSEVNLQIFLQLFLAILLGSLIGIERERQERAAGFRTFALVSLACTLFTILSLGLTELNYSQAVSLDPIRIIQSIAIGFGFLGAGIIIYRRFRLEGLTTAVALWITSAIGVAVGLEQYFLAILVTFLVIIVLAGFREIEKRIWD